MSSLLSSASAARVGCSLLLALAPALTSVAQSVFEVAPGLFDHSDGRTLGLKTVPSEKIMLYHATDRNWTCNLDLAMTTHNGRVYAMWGNGEKDESGPGQRILYTSSADGLNWDEPQVLFDPKTISTDPKLFLGAGGWLTLDDGTLVGFASDRRTVYSSTSKDGRNWSTPVDMGLGERLGAYYKEGPKKVEGGYVWLGQEGRTKERNLRFLHFTDPLNPASWQQAQIDNTEVLGNNEWREPSMFVRKDGTLVARIRASWERGKAKSPEHMFAAESRDGGKTWQAGTTNFPDAIAKSSAGNLPDGTAYIVSNPGKPRDRRVLAISLSDDGKVFDRAYAIGIDPPPVRFVGRYKGASLPGYQGPATAVLGDYLYVGATVSKDDVAVFRIALSDLQP